MDLEITEAGLGYVRDLDYLDAQLVAARAERDRTPKGQFVNTGSAFTSKRGELDRLVKAIALRIHVLRLEDETVSHNASFGLGGRRHG